MKCEVCGLKALPKDADSHDFYVYDGALWHYDTQFGWEGNGANFCPNCGKPLTAAKPITLDELRERDGRPVWEDECGEWLIVDVGDDGEVLMWGVGGSICVFVEDDGEAQPHYYDRPPETSAE